MVLFILLGNKKYEISFDTTGGSIVETQTIKKGKTALKPTDPTKAGYTFDKWYFEDEIFDFSTPIIKNIKLVAKWIQNVDSEPKEKFVVSFDTNGGNSISSLNIEENGLINKPNNPTKSGYTFVSWQLNGTDFDFSTPVTKNIELLAKWEKVTNTNKPNDDKPSTIAVTSVRVSQTSLNLKVGQNLTLTATVNPSNATNKTISWSSNNNSVATVDANGKVIGRGAGTATIKVTAGGQTATCTVTVAKEITYSIEWVKVDESSIGQYTLYIKNSEGNYVAGKAEITTISGKTEVIDIPVSGKMYIKSAISNATVKSIN